jgi:hypothetical protein
MRAATEQQASTVGARMSSRPMLSATSTGALR